MTIVKFNFIIFITLIKLKFRMNKRTHPQAEYLRVSLLVYIKHFLALTLSPIPHTLRRNAYLTVTVYPLLMRLLRRKYKVRVGVIMLNGLKNMIK